MLTLTSKSRVIGQCQAAVAEAVAAFGKIDILFCCTSEGMYSPAVLLVPPSRSVDEADACPAVIGTVEELAASQRTLTLVREQFETNFFGPVNIIKAALPAMREKRSGHVIVLTGISRSISVFSAPLACRRLMELFQQVISERQGWASTVRRGGHSKDSAMYAFSFHSVAESPLCTLSLSPILTPERPM